MRYKNAAAHGNQQRLLHEWNSVFDWRDAAAVNIGDSLFLAVPPSEWRRFVAFLDLACKNPRSWRCRHTREVWWQFPTLVITDNAAREFADIAKAFDSSPGYWDWRIQPKPTSRRTIKIKPPSDDAVIIDAIGEAAAVYGYQLSDAPRRFGRGSVEFLRLSWKMRSIEVESQAIFVFDITPWIESTSTLSVTPILLGCHLRFANEPWSRCDPERRKGMLDDLDKIVDTSIATLTKKE